MSRVVMSGEFDPPAQCQRSDQGVRMYPAVQNYRVGSKERGDERRASARQLCKCGLDRERAGWKDTVRRRDALSTIPYPADPLGREVRGSPFVRRRGERLGTPQHDELADADINPRYVFDDLDHRPLFRRGALRLASNGHTLDLRQESRSFVIEECEECVGIGGHDQSASSFRICRPMTIR